MFGKNWLFLVLTVEVQKDGLILMFIFKKKTYAIGFNWTIFQLNSQQ